MEVRYPRCAGLDVHAKSIMGCLRIATGGTVTYEHRTVSTRTRKQLGREHARHTQRIPKTFEDANVKLTEVLSDILGMSGCAILHALVAGETNPERLADLTRGRLKGLAGADGRRADGSGDRSSSLSDQPASHPH